MEERVQKIISNAGYCSRRHAEELIEKGKVRVNGRVIKIGDKADVEKDEIYVNSDRIEAGKKIYIMLNKPRGYEVTLNPEIEKNVLRLIDIPERVIPVGRLDKNTSGLLLLTNDGDFANKIMHPRYEKEKTYYVKVDKQLSDTDIETIRDGLHLRDGKVQGKVKKYQKDQVELTIHEGKKWIVKRLFFKLGYYVKDLARVRIGNLRLDVKIGKWRYLKQREVDELLR